LFPCNGTRGRFLWAGDTRNDFIEEMEFSLQFKDEKDQVWEVSVVVVGIRENKEVKIYKTIAEMVRQPCKCRRQGWMDRE
jgi:hypothetical protein